MDGNRRPSRWQKRFFSWIDRRLPASNQVTLTRHNLFIFPSLAGFCFLGLSLLLWLLGTSYQNNLVLALSYLLMSLMVVSIFHTYANLNGLMINVLSVKSTFVGEHVFFTLETNSKQNRNHNNLNIRWWNGEDKSIDVIANQKGVIEVGLYADKRGYFHPGKLLIETYFPLGLIRCWTWLNLDTQALIFPKPLNVKLPVQTQGDNEDDHGELVAGGDDFSGLKEYQPGDSLKHIAWKHYAREQGLYSKEYSRASNSEVWLRWDDFSALDFEERLRALCYWALQYDSADIAYGLELPNERIVPQRGDEHRLNVLSKLARFDLTLSSLSH